MPSHPSQTTSSSNRKAALFAILEAIKSLSKALRSLEEAIPEVIKKPSKSSKPLTQPWRSQQRSLKKLSKSHLERCLRLHWVEARTSHLRLQQVQPSKANLRVLKKPWKRLKEPMNPSTKPSKKLLALSPAPTSSSYWWSLPRRYQQSLPKQLIKLSKTPSITTSRSYYKALDDTSSGAAIRALSKYRRRLEAILGAIDEAILRAIDEAVKAILGYNK